MGKVENDDHHLPLVKYENGAIGDSSSRAATGRKNYFY